MTTQIRFEILDKRLRAFPFVQATKGSAGYDLRACLLETLVLKPDEVKLIGSGLKIKMSRYDMAAMVLPRSGLGHRHGLVLGNLVGLIDSDYTGELMISAWNRSTQDVQIEPMDRIAQLIFVPIVQTTMVECLFNDSTTRGSQGFSSTGKQ